MEYTENGVDEVNLNPSQSEIQHDLLSGFDQSINRPTDNWYKKYMLPLEKVDTPASMKKRRAKGRDLIGKSINKNQNHFTSFIGKS